MFRYCTQVHISACGTGRNGGPLPVAECAAGPSGSAMNEENLS